MGFAVSQESSSFAPTPSSSVSLLCGAAAAVLEACVAVMQTMKTIKMIHGMLHSCQRRMLVMVSSCAPFFEEFPTK